jgi:hypothetical protein
MDRQGSAATATGTNRYEQVSGRERPRIEARTSVRQSVKKTTNGPARLSVPGAVATMTRERAYWRVTLPLSASAKRRR